MILSQEYIKLNCETIDNYFLDYNNSLEKIDFPKVKTIGNYFLFDNKYLKSIDLPNVKKIGNGFLYYNRFFNREQFLK